MTTGIEPLAGQTKTAVRSHHWRMIWAIARKDNIESIRNTQMLLIGLMPVLVIPSQFLAQGLNDALTHTNVTAANTTNLIVWTAFMLLVVLITFWRVSQKPQSIIA